jgi:hypothetical protein
MVDRKVVPFDEFYYQLKLTDVFQKHPVYQFSTSCILYSNQIIFNDVYKDNNAYQNHFVKSNSKLYLPPLFSSTQYFSSVSRHCRKCVIRYLGLIFSIFLCYIKKCNYPVSPN